MAIVYLPYRGLSINRRNITPELGKFLYTLDTKEVWIGDGRTVGGMYIGYMPTLVAELIDEEIRKRKKINKKTLWQVVMEKLKK